MARAQPSLAETVLAAYLDQYQQRQATSALGLPFPSWEPNFLIAEIYSELAERAANDSFQREAAHLAFAGARGRSEQEYVNALGFLWSLPAAIRATDELPPEAVTEAFETGADKAVFAAAAGVFWRMRFMAAAHRLLPGNRALRLEFKWWQRRLEQSPDPDGDEAFDALARRALLQAEFAKTTKTIGDAARATIVLIADEDRYPTNDIATVDIARALMAARICGEDSAADNWLDELLTSRLDKNRRLLFSRAQGARYEQSPWVARALVSATPTLDYLLGALSRPLSGLRSKEVAR